MTGLHNKIFSVRIDLQYMIYLRHYAVCVKAMFQKQGRSMQVLVQSLGMLIRA